MPPEALWISMTCATDMPVRAFKADHDVALQEHGLIGELPKDHKGAEFVGGADEPLHVAHKTGIAVGFCAGAVAEHG